MVDQFVSIIFDRTNDVHTDTYDYNLVIDYTENTLSLIILIISL